MGNSTSFKKGNQLWRNVDPKNLGNPKYKTPQELWEDAVKYFDHCDENPIEVTETTTGDRNSVKIKHHKIPYTWKGLYIFCSVKDLAHYKTKTEFSDIISVIGDIIYNQKFEGASSGLFNSNIIARDLGLIDRKDHTTGGSKIGQSVKVNIKR